jgi:hypothetical protein
MMRNGAPDAKSVAAVGLFSGCDAAQALLLGTKLQRLECDPEARAQPRALGPATTAPRNQG